MNIYFIWFVDCYLTVSDGLLTVGGILHIYKSKTNSFIISQTRERDQNKGQKVKKMEYSKVYIFVLLCVSVSQVQSYGIWEKWNHCK